MLNKILLLAQLVYILESKFQVIYPQDLSEQFNKIYPDVTDTDMKGSLNYSHSNFGINPYGQVIKGYIKYPPKNLNSSSSKTTGCEPLEELYPIEKVGKKTFLLVDRGECSFLQKALFAQQSGASVLLIADNEINDHPEQHILVPDNEGTHLQIPTIMIRLEDAQLIKNAVKYEEKGVYVRFEVEHPNRTKFIEIEYWMKLFSPSSFAFLQQLQKFIENELTQEERSMIRFSPNYEIWYCYSCKKASIPYRDPNQDCISGGRYCQIDPDGSSPGSLTGSDVVNEIITQICIQQMINTTVYLEYMLDFKTYVINDYKNQKSKIIQRLFDRFSSKEKAQINQCISSSYEGSVIKDPFVDNYLMRQMRNKQLYREQEFASFPALVVNNMTFQGDIDQADAIYEFICEAMLEPAQNCSKYDRRKAYVVDRVQEPNSEANEPQSYTGLIIGIVICSVLVFGLFLFCYRKLLKRDLVRQVQGEANVVIQNYFQMREDGKQ